MPSRELILTREEMIERRRQLVPASVFTRLGIDGFVQESVATLHRADGSEYTSTVVLLWGYEPGEGWRCMDVSAKAERE